MEKGNGLERKASEEKGGIEVTLMGFMHSVRAGGDIDKLLRCTHIHIAR